MGLDHSLAESIDDQIEGGGISHRCMPCDPGYYDNDLSATTPCVPCVDGTYSDTIGSVMCSKCPVGQTSPEASTSVAACVDMAPREYVGCYVDGPDSDGLSLSDLADDDLPYSHYKDVCEEVCAKFDYMGLTWASQCRYTDLVDKSPDHQRS